MLNIFEIVDKTGRNLRLTQKPWSHITIKHSYMANYLEEIKEALISPTKIISHHKGNLFDYYKYYKQRQELKFLKVVVKYLNGEGFVLSAYFTPKIRE